MRPDVVVVMPPVLDDGVSLLQAGEPMQVQTVVSKLAVEALYKGILGP